MTTKIDIKCHRCGYQWQQELADLRAERVIYRGEAAGGGTRLETYLVTCPNDGSKVTVEVEIAGGDND